MTGRANKPQGSATDKASFLTVKETAAHLHLCEKQVRRLITKGTSRLIALVQL